MEIQMMVILSMITKWFGDLHTDGTILESNIIGE